MDSSSPRQDWLESIVEAALQALHLTGTVGIRLGDDDEIRQLNATYRGVDSSTDVLAFCYEAAHSRVDGDIAISLPTAQRQASLRGIPLHEEIHWLVIHGLLHLAGYDDEEEHDRVVMWQEMSRLGARLGLPPQDEWVSLQSDHPAQVTL